MKQYTKPSVESLKLSLTAGNGTCPNSTIPTFQSGGAGNKKHPYQCTLNFKTFCNVGTCEYAEHGEGGTDNTSGV